MNTHKFISKELLIFTIKEKFDNDFKSYILKHNNNTILSKNPEKHLKYINVKTQNYTLQYIKNEQSTFNGEYILFLYTLESAEELEKYENKLSVIKYRVSEIAKLLESVFEYMSIEILIEFYYEKIKEIYSLSKGMIFKLQDEKYISKERSLSFKCEECKNIIKFPFPVNLKYQKENFLSEEALKILNKNEFDILIPISQGEKNSFIIALSGENISKDEMELIDLSGRLFNKALKLQKVVEDNKIIANDLSKRSFEILVLLETTKLVLSSKTYDQLANKIGDMLMEVFQSEWSVSFFKKGDVFEPGFYRSIKKENIELPNILQLKNCDKYVFLNEEIKKLYDIFNIPKIIKIKNPRGALLYGSKDNINGITIFGRSISGFNFESESNVIFVEAVRNTVETAIENIKFISQIEEERDRSRKYLEIIKSIFEFEKILEQVTDIQEIIDLVKAYLENAFEFHNIEIDVNCQKYTKDGIYIIDGKEYIVVPIYYEEKTIGYIKCGNRKGYPLNSKENFLILNILSGALSPYLILKNLNPQKEYIDMAKLLKNLILGKIEKIRVDYETEANIYITEKKPEKIIGTCLKIGDKYLYITPIKINDRKKVELENIKITFR